MLPNGFASHEELIGIYDIRAAVDPLEWQDELDDWEENDVYVNCSSDKTISYKSFCFQLCG